MSLVVANLPDPEVSFLRQGGLAILDWGCAFGEGAAVLKERFPVNDVTGLDFAELAVKTAELRHQECRFIHSVDGSIPTVFDVITISNCLEHFEHPLDVVREHLPFCRSLYVILVPYNEYPLHEQHRAQLREESFPERLGTFVRLGAKVVKADPRWWNGEQLLVTYGSPQYLQQRFRTTSVVARQDELGNAEDRLSRATPGSVDELGLELTRLVFDLVPEGKSVLETGFGPEWHGVVIDRTGGRVISRADADTVSAAGGAESTSQFDVVLNVGGTRRETFAETVEFIRVLARLSARYVLLVWPNPDSYWYRVWRAELSADPTSGWGREAAVGPLTAALASAGLHELGTTPVGSACTENVIAALPGLTDELRATLLNLHRSPLVSPRQRSYLLATLASVKPENDLPEVWESSAVGSEPLAPQLAAALADAIALSVADRRHLLERDARLRETEALLQDERRRSAALMERVDASQRARDDVELELRAKLRDAAARFHAYQKMIGEGDERLRAEIAALRASASWRIGNKVVRAVRALPGARATAALYRRRQQPRTDSISS
jgi:hypothetical protein